MHKICENTNPICDELISKHVEKSKSLDQIVSRRHCFYIYNHNTSKFEYFSQGLSSISGYSREDYNTLGKFPLFEICHPDDAFILNSLLFHDIKKVANSASLEDRTRLKIQYNYRIVRKDKRICNIQIQNNFLEIDEEGNPLLSFGYCSQIPFNDGPYYCGLTIFLIEETSSDILFQKFYNHINSKNGLNISDREKEVLELLIDGLTSKEIGEKLHISKNTVDNHRRNLLRKFEVRRTNDLTRLAMKEHIK